MNRFSFSLFRSNPASRRPRRSCYSSGLLLLVASAACGAPLSLGDPLPTPSPSPSAPNAPAPVALTHSLAVLAGQVGGAGNLDGIGGEARFRNPSAMARVGNTIYVADRYNDALGERFIGSVLRKVDLATGEVTSIAGGQARNALQLGNDGVGADASFYDIHALAYDGADTLYVADHLRIRKVALSTRRVSSLAFEFAPLRGMTLDPAGSLYVSSGEAVYRVDPVTENVEHLAGALLPEQYRGNVDGVGSSARFSNPGALTLWQGRLLVADQFGTVLRAVEINTRAVTTLAGVANAPEALDGADPRFLNVTGFSTRGASLRITEGDLSRGSSRLVRSMVNGYVRTELWAEPGGSSSATGSVDDYILLGPTVARFDGNPPGFLFGMPSSSGASDGKSSSARFSHPTTLVSDGQRFLYVSDGGTQNDRVRRVDSLTGETATILRVAAQPDGLGLGLAIDGRGHLLVASTGRCVIDEVDLVTHSVRTVAGVESTCTRADGARSIATFQAPSSLAIDGMGPLFVGETSAIRQVDWTTGATDTLISGGGVQGRVCAMAVSGQALFFVDGCDSGLRSVGRLDLATRTVTTLIRRAGANYCEESPSEGLDARVCLGSVTSLTVDGTEDLLLADNSHHVVSRLNLRTRQVHRVLGIPGSIGVRSGAWPGSLNHPAGIAFVGGRLAISDAAENAILLADLPKGGVPTK